MLSNQSIYASLCSSTWSHLLCLKLCQHNPSTPTSMSLQLACTSPAAATSKKEQQQEKDHARSCKNLACKTCLTRARDMSLSCTILAQSCINSCKILQKMCKECRQLFLQQLLQNLAPFLARYVPGKIVQESCKKRDISRARAKQVLHARFLQDSCTILHDLASSFLLGRVLHLGASPGEELACELTRWRLCS